jgi:peptidoglycan/LPS O-acetylase OafA/YrhL
MRNETLDGLRGIAVLLVLFYHHGLLNSGWIGVDIFFVLSGYLITTILRRHRGTSDFWSSFWIKRATRILPPFLLVLAATALLGFALSAGQAGLYLLSLGDVMAYLRPAFEPLRPLWSLAVEEHFYLLWPFAVRYMDRRKLVAILLGLIVAEPVLRACMSLFTHDWQTVYFLTPFRLDGLCLGSLLAVALESPAFEVNLARYSAPAGLLSAFTWIGMRLVLGGRFTRDNPTAYYNAIGYSLVSFGAACLISYLLTHPQSLLARMIAARWLAATGLISYGLYLYQVPVHQVMMRSYPGLGGRSIWVDSVITFALATASYQWYEKPMMRLGKRWIGAVASRPAHTAGAESGELSIG